MPEENVVSPPPSLAPRRNRWLWVVLPLLLLGAGIYLYSQTKNSSNAKAASNKGGGKQGRKADLPAVPVVGARATKGDIGVYYNGLGTVTPISTVKKAGSMEN